MTPSPRMTGGRSRKKRRLFAAVGFGAVTATVAARGTDAAFVVPGPTLPRHHGGATMKPQIVFAGQTAAPPPSSSSSSELGMVMAPALASLVSGSIAGAIGVGVAFPLDTLKTKTQVMGQRQQRSRRESGDGDCDAQTQAGSTPSASLSSPKVDDGEKKFVADSPRLSGMSPSESVSDMNMVQLFALIYRNEGMRGFFGGVRTMMLGQALIKSVAFGANSSALAFLQDHFQAEGTASLALLVAAACFSGFVTSFLVAPVERVKVLMQASDDGTYRNELDCLRTILENDGWDGLLCRGLGPTLAREVPSYAIYFVVYESLVRQTVLAQSMGGAAPLVFGALSGCACWVPVYPIDVVKTLVQNSDGGGDRGRGNAREEEGNEAIPSRDSPPSAHPLLLMADASSVFAIEEESTFDINGEGIGTCSNGGDTNWNEEGVWDVARNLYDEGGIPAFFDGLTPKMLRAAVNHSVTFWIYDLAMKTLVTGGGVAGS